jgi:ATP-dependent Clp endopeptidase proteolytic subunit ClpP
MKQILLYSPIFSFTAETFINQFAQLDPNEDVVIRVNSPGGSVFAGWGMTKAMQDHKGKVTVKVDGIAASMAFYLAMFADEVEALDVSRFLVHRADGYTNSEDEKKELANINAIMRGKLEKRIGADVFQQITGVSYDEVFDENQRKNVWISAKDAKKIGLVDKITRLEPKEIEAMNETFYAFSESLQGSSDVQGSTQEKPIINNNQTDKKMTINDLQAQHPELYAQVVALGVKQEQIRVKSWIAYLDIDKENVTASIKDGKEFTPDVMSEMAVKMQAKATVAAIEKDSTEKVTTEKPNDKTAEQKEVEAFEKEVLEGVKKIKIY